MKCDNYIVAWIVCDIMRKVAPKKEKVVSEDKGPNRQAAAYASVISQIGCTTSLASIVIIAIAFGLGRLLDSYLDTRGVFTVLFLVGSFPVTLYVVLRIALATSARAQRLVARGQDENNHEHEEESDI